jgi:hypothetical protein
MCFFGIFQVDYSEKLYISADTGTAVKSCLFVQRNLHLSLLVNRKCRHITRKLVLWPQCQFSHNESRVFEEKKIRVIVCQMNRRTGRVNFSKLCHTSERKYLLFKGEFRGSV